MHSVSRAKSRILENSFLAIAAVLLFVAASGCASPKSTDNGLKTLSATELKSLNNLDECPDLNGAFHRKDGVAASRSILLGKTESGVAKMSMEKKLGTTEAQASVDGYTIDGERHFSRTQDLRKFDYIAICTENRLRVSIFEGDRNIHNILYIKTLEGFDIQQHGEFGDSLTQWLPTK